MPLCSNCKVIKETDSFGISKKTKRQYKCCNNCRVYLNNPKAKEYRKLKYQKNLSKREYKNLKSLYKKILITPQKHISAQIVENTKSTHNLD